MSENNIPKRPFHEVIVTAICQASSAELQCLTTLIKTTKIPKGHDAIITAWNNRRKAMCWGDEDLGVPASVLEQKREYSKPPNIDINELQLEAQKLISLLRNHDIGIISLSDPLYKSIENLYEITSHAFGNKKSV